MKQELFSRLDTALVEHSIFCVNQSTGAPVLHDTKITERNIRDIGFLGAGIVATVNLALSDEYASSITTIGAILLPAYVAFKLRGRDQLTLENQEIKFNKRVRIHSFPVIKYCFMRILLLANRYEYTDKEVSAAIKTLQSFLESQGWKNQFLQATQEYPYMKYWLEYTTHDSHRE